ncbi:MAG: gamma carbonic anhydrase family protein [Sulfurifustaceae bacterium]
MKGKAEQPGKPAIDPTAFVAPNAVVVGDVTIGPETVISYGAVLVAEGGRIAVGKNSVVMENAVIRSTRFNDCVIGNNVIVGPHCHLSGCRIEDEVFIATGASVFNGAHVKRHSELRINAIVHLRTVLEEESTVPIGWIAVGDPARCFPPDKHEEIWAIQKPLNFPEYIFAVPRESDSPDSPVKQMTDKYSKYLLRRHAELKG